MMEAQQLLDILAIAHRLKINTRHNWMEGGRQESVADHSWRVSLMALLLKDEEAFQDVNMDKVIEMCLIHDLGEAFTGDIPTFEKTNSDNDIEEQLFLQWLNQFPSPQKEHWLSLFDEMKQLESMEAKTYKALDKLEAVIAHNEADSSTWLPLEKDLQLTYAVQSTAFSTYLTNLRETVDDWTRCKIETEE